MLQKLEISNYVLIDSLVFEPGSGLNTITGETGAGKSILIGALGLILGDRADFDAVGKNSSKCVIEGYFDLTELGLLEFFTQSDLDYSDHTILRREILDSGRSRAFVNDTPVSLNVLKELGSRLVDIHSQHQSHQLGDTDFMFNWLDAVCGTTFLMNQYKDLYIRLRSDQKLLADLMEMDLQESAQADYNNFLWDELDKADLKEDELAKLESELELLENAEAIGTVIGQAYSRIQESEMAMVDELNGIGRALLKLAPEGSELMRVAERIMNVNIELSDAVHELRRVGDGIQTDAERMDILNNRVKLIHQLMKRHHVGEVSGLISIRDQLSDKLYEGAGRKEEIAQLRKQVELLETETTGVANELHENRLVNQKEIEDFVNGELSKLGLANARIALRLEKNLVLTGHGLSLIQLLLSSNKGQPFLQAASIASGGEVSRLMLIIKSQMAKHRKLPSIIFDEIDTGVSGEISRRMADVMAELAKDLQVLSITHLPQIAARGNHHFYVYKEVTGNQTHTSIRSLAGDERIKEIAKMLSGDQPTEGALTNAKELLLGVV